MYVVNGTTEYGTTDYGTTDYGTTDYANLVVLLEWFHA